ncbi:MAG: PD-(D/E)XK nuclease family protein [Candidatus Tectomicrobia bacterium]|nr:PD-(D/E)XK nuclease family protein [Candidatus Tectomicrobia bacterium]
MFRLFCGPPRSGKTTRLVAHLLDAYAENPLGDGLLVLVPGNVAAEALRRRFVAQGALRGIVGNPFKLLLDAARACLLQAAKPARELNPSDRRLLLKEVCAEIAAAGRLTGLAQMLEHRGFLASLAALLTEIAEARIAPGDLRLAASHLADQAEGRRCGELAGVAERYAALCRERHLLDREALFAQAIALVRSGEDALPTPLRLLAIDGFYDFNELQWAFVQALIERAEQATATLLYESRRPELYALVEPLARRLRGLADEVVELRAAETTDLPGALRVLQHDLFRPAQDGAEETKVAAAGGLEVLSGGNEAAAHAVLAAACKRLIRQGVCEPGGIGLVARQLDRHRRGLMRALEAHGLPFTCSDPEPLAAQPVVRFCQRALKLLVEDWPAPSVLDLMTSPYYGLDEAVPEPRPGGSAAGTPDAPPPPRRSGAAFVELRAAVVACGVTGGLASWRQRLSARRAYLEGCCRGEVAAREDDLAEEGAYEARAAAEGPAAQLQRHQEAISRFEALFARGEAVPRRSEAGDVAEKLVAFLDGLGVEEAIAASEQEDLRARDARALHRWRQEVRAAAAAFGGLGGSATIELAAFAAYLEERLEESRFPWQKRQQSAERAILLCDANTARQRQFDVLLLGDVESGAFPPRPRQSPLLNDAARARLNRRLAPLPGTPLRDDRLELSTTRQQEERLLFYLCATRPSRRLLLGYTCEDEADPQSGRSPFLAEVERLVEVSPPAREHRAAASVLLPARQVWRFGDLRLAAFARLAAARAEELGEAPGLRRLRELLPKTVSAPGTARSLPFPLLESAEDATLLRLLAALRVEQRRLRADEHSRWSGRLGAAAVRDTLAAELDGECFLNATALTDYGKCPFRYFANQRLRLKPAESRARPLQPLEEGNLAHGILEEFYTAEAAAGRLPLRPEDLAAAAARLRRIAEESFRRFARGWLPVDAGRWEAEQRELLKVLTDFLEADATRCAEKAGRFLLPAYFELPFGAPRRAPRHDPRREAGRHVAARVAAGRAGGALDDAGDPSRRPEALPGLHLPGAPRRGGALSFACGPTTVHLRGVIDRVDYVYERNAAGAPELRGSIVLDYKRSQVRDSGNFIEQGITFQLPLYVWAVHSLLPEAPPLQAGYVLLRNLRNEKQRMKYVLPPRDASEQWREELEEGTRRHIARFLARLREGDFSLAPIDCEESCPFRPACRINSVRSETELQEEGREGAYEATTDEAAP